MKRILVAVSEYPPYGSGIGNVVFALKKHLSQKSIHTTVISRHGADINISNNPSTPKGLFELIPFWRRVSDYIAKHLNKYDAFWLHSPLMLDASTLIWDKTVVSLHTTYYGFYHAYKGSALARLLPYYYIAMRLEHRFFSQLGNSGKAEVTAVSQSVAEESYKNGLSFFPKVIPNGFDTDIATTLGKEESRNYLVKEYSLNISKDDTVLFYLGRITEQKQPLLLLNYFKQLNSVNPHLRLIMCGKGNLLSKLKKKVEQERNVFLLGHVPSENLPLLMKASDVFISLSCYEGFPLTVLEAAAYGLPLVLSNIPPHEDIIKSGIGVGTLVDVHNPTTNGILETINTLRNSGCDKSARSKHAFSWESISNRYLQLLF